MKYSIFVSFFSFVETLQAATLNVGSGQTYSTITAAYNAASAGDTIYIYPGTYTEKLTISKDSITLKGSAYPSTSPSSNEAVITYSTYASAAGSDDASATLLVSGNNFKMYNLNVSNTAGTGGQAVALSMRGDYGGVYACGLKSYQDTLYSHIGSQFFGRCYIEGAVDFIFGITANSWYQGCTLGVLKSGGTITAQGRTSSSTDGFFVFDKAKIVLGSGAGSGTKGNTYLGRPWGDYARVVFQNSNEENIVISAGWEAWSSSQSTANILFAEYDNTNAAGTRVSWAKALTSAYAISTILPTYSSWVDSSYLGVSAP
ncbi:pectin lyase-like protein [Mollisia scopiformis]|uniref:Pectinesterase n=1 Tax=Mollisia scopiformis TaxID=149040 RepID=A0A194XW37_MOLSC|nr:pectin lyase-like protein [Mollisia scopiformis]KUJ24351.1 pectin lyase-like protein [Mollisia scopiformis]